MFSDFINSAIWTALGWTIIHFLWQGSFIGLLTVILLHLNASSKATTRYIIACCALLFSLLVFSSTLLLLFNGTQQANSHPMLAVEFSTVLANLTIPSKTRGDVVVQVVSLLWIVGILMMLIRLLRHQLGAYYIKTVHVTKPSSKWMQYFNELVAEMGITKTVRFLQSGIVDSPMVIGWIFPVILLPTYMLTSLTPDQIRAILIHELSHIRRNDQVVNFIQTIAELVLFFHPAMWWISKQIRDEREHCCDDATVQNTGKPRFLAEALLQLELLRTSQTHNQAALSATGGSLMNRITRLLNCPKKSSCKFTWKAPLSIAALTIVTTISLFVFNHELQAAQPNNRPERTNQPDRIRGDEDRQAERDWWSGLTRRIENAVEQGLMTREEADVTYKEIRSKLGGRGDRDLRDSRRGMKNEPRQGVVDWSEALKRNESAVEQGVMTRTEADEAIKGIKAGQKALGDSRRQIRAELEAVGLKIREAVASGKLTKEEGRQKMEAARDKLARVSIDWEGIKKLIEGAVERGLMTREEADVTYKEIRTNFDERKNEDRRFTRENFAAAKAKMKKMVDSGEITQEQMDKRLLGMRSRMQKKPQNRDIDWDGITRKIEEAVEQGIMTRTKADAVIKGLREERNSLREGRNPARNNLSEIGAKIREAVASGQLSREEGRQLMETVREFARPDADKDD